MLLLRTRLEKTGTNHIIRFNQFCRKSQKDGEIHILDAIDLNQLFKQKLTPERFLLEWFQQVSDILANFRQIPEIIYIYRITKDIIKTYNCSHFHSVQLNIRIS